MLSNVCKNVNIYMTNASTVDARVANAIGSGSIEISDHRDDIPVFIHSELDDLPISSEAFRVYCHLVRRCGRNGKAWPSITSIGNSCFSIDYPNSKITRRKHAMAAIKELEDMNLIEVTRNKPDHAENKVNVYRLTPKREWKKKRIMGGSVGELGSSRGEPRGSVGEPKGIPLEGNTLESSPDQATYGSLEANKVSQLTDFEFEEFHHGKKLEDPSLDKRISRSEPTKQILSVGEKDQDPHPQFRGTPSPAAKKIRREKTKVIEPTENRQGVFRPVGAGKQIQRAVLKAMQIWVWDEWVKTCNFRMTIAPDGKTWFYDGDKGGWHDEDTLPSLTKMIDLAGAERSSLDAISIDDLNEYGRNLFETLKNDSALLKRFYCEPVAVVCEYDLEPVDWDELPEDACEEEDIPIPF